MTAYSQNGLSATIIDGEAVSIRTEDCGTTIEMTLQEFTDMAYAVIFATQDQAMSSPGDKDYGC